LVENLLKAPIREDCVPDVTLARVDLDQQPNRALAKGVYPGGREGTLARLRKPTGHKQSSCGCFEGLQLRESKLFSSNCKPTFVPAGQQLSGRPLGHSCLVIPREAPPSPVLHLGHITSHVSESNDFALCDKEPASVPS
jgi:hypothetical protein